MEVRDPDETDVSSEDDTASSVPSVRRDPTQNSLAGEILVAFSQVHNVHGEVALIHRIFEK